MDGPLPSSKHCKRLNWPKSWMFSTIQYFLVISQVDQTQVSEFRPMLPTRPPIDQTTVSAQPPRLGLCYERGRLPNEQLRNAANPAQEHRWLVKPNPCGRTCVWSIWAWDVNASCGSRSLNCDATITINILKIPPCFPAGYAKYGRFSWKRFPKKTSFGNRIFLKYSKFKKTC